MNTSKHLTLQDRQNIELMLNAKKDFTEIAQAIGKHKSTISREIRAHVACMHPHRSKWCSLQQLQKPIWVQENQHLRQVQFTAAIQTLSPMQHMQFPLF